MTQVIVPGVPGSPLARSVLVALGEERGAPHRIQTLPLAVLRKAA